LNNIQFGFEKNIYKKAAKGPGNEVAIVSYDPQAKMTPSKGSKKPGNLIIKGN